MAPTIAEKIRDFRFDRLAKIRAGDAPLREPRSGVLGLHILPLAAFAGCQRLDVQAIDAAVNNGRFTPLGLDPTMHVPARRPNLDGLLVDGGSVGGIASTRLQIWRSGQIEAVRDSLVSSTNGSGTLVPMRMVVRDVLATLRTCVQGLDTLGIAPPHVIFLTLLGSRGSICRWGSSPALNETQFSDDVVPTSGVLMAEAQEMDDQTVATLLRPAFDEIANAAGLDASPIFDANGCWVVDDP